MLETLRVNPSVPLMFYRFKYLKLFYFRMDARIDIFQTNTKLNVSKEKYPKIVVKCSNCSFFVFINIHCPGCQNEFYCDETFEKVRRIKIKEDEG